MSRLRYAAIAIAVVLIILAWQQVLAAQAGLTVRSLNAEGAPAIFMAPADTMARPAALIAHGFSGSKQLMLAYGHTLAHAGYAVLLWDFDGHGANPAPAGADSLQENIEAAYSLLSTQPEADPQRVALLGHSMGSGAVMTAGINDPQRYAAVIAVSPTGADVSPALPPNLLLQAGAWEGRFVANAEHLLAQAGGPNDDLAGGVARRLVIIPAAEHISILFRTPSHQAALAWLDGVFGAQGPHAYTDRRINWFLVHLLAWLVAILAAAPWLRRYQGQEVGPADRIARWRTMGAWRWLGVIVGPLIATLGLVLLNVLTPAASLGGIQVGMAMSLWFGLAGLVWLAVGRLRPGRLSLRDLALGLLMFVLLTVAFGLMAQTVWMQWWLIGPRLLRWPFMAALCLPWFLASGVVRSGAERRGVRSLVWWLGESLCLLVGLATVVIFVPGMFFVFLLLPLVPLLMGILTLAGVGFSRPWSYALGSALFFGWVLAAVFPLAG